MIMTIIIYYVRSSLAWIIITHHFLTLFGIFSRNRPMPKNHTDVSDTFNTLCACVLILQRNCTGNGRFARNFS